MEGRTPGLPSDEARSSALAGYTAAGFTPDDFAHRPPARSAMLESLIRTEDWLEMTHPNRKHDRAEIRVARRALESETE